MTKPTPKKWILVTLALWILVTLALVLFWGWFGYRVGFQRGEYNGYKTQAGYGRFECGFYGKQVRIDENTVGYIRTPEVDECLSYQQKALKQQSPWLFEDLFVKD